jgi:hypothetical protein
LRTLVLRASSFMVVLPIDSGNQCPAVAARTIIANQNPTYA